MISKISEKSRTKESIRLEEYYNQWRFLQLEQAFHTQAWLT